MKLMHWLIYAISGAAVSLVLLYIARSYSFMNAVYVAIPIGVAIFILFLNPTLRYFRAFWVLGAVWLSVVAASSYELDAFGMKGTMINESPHPFVHVCIVILLVALLVLDWKLRGSGNIKTEDKSILEVTCSGCVSQVFEVPDRPGYTQVFVCPICSQNVRISVKDQEVDVRLVELEVERVPLLFSEVYSEARNSQNAYKAYQDGYNFQSEGNYLDALNSYVKARDLDDDCIEAHVQEGLMLCLLGRWEIAKVKYEQLIPRIPLNQNDQLSLANMNMGWLKETEKDWKGALAFYRKSYQYDNTNVLALGNVLQCETILEDGLREETLNKLQQYSGFQDILNQLLESNDEFRTMWESKITNQTERKKDE